MSIVKHAVQGLAVVCSLGLLLASIGCQTPMRSATASGATQAPPDLPEAARLDVAVVEFDTGLEPGEAAPANVSLEIREAESKLLAVQLRDTLERSGQWGVTTVVPREPIASELLVTAEILESSGLELELRVRARDATGREWLERSYRTPAPEGSYGTKSAAVDPYQPMFNTIANDLAEARSSLSSEELERITTIAELRFAADLSPESFEGYLSVDSDGTVGLLRLPALEDPMLQRAAEVRLRDEMFLETMGVYYQNFSAQIDDNYWHWRKASSEEVRARQKLRQEQIVRGIGAALATAAIVGAGAAGNSSAAIAAAAVGSAIIQEQINQINNLGQERQLREAGLRELRDSFQAEVQPVVIELGESQLRLSGTAEAQYEEWQRLMRNLYRAENDIVADVYRAPRRPTEEAWLANPGLPKGLAPRPSRPLSAAQPL